MEAVSPGVRRILVVGLVGVLALAAFPRVRHAVQQWSDDAHAARMLAERAAERGSVSLPDDPASAPAFRAGDGTGRYDGAGLLLRWPEGGPPELWRRAIGGGHAGFAVGGGRAVTMEQRLDEEVVAAYDLATGTQLWAHAYPARFSESMGGDGPRSTPTLVGGLVVALGAEGDLHALDVATGAVRWHHQVLTELGAENNRWGLAASPVVVDGLVVAAGSGQESAGFVAYDLESGAERWTSEWIRQGYTTPVLATVHGVPQLVHLSDDGLTGLAPDTGDTLWSFRWEAKRGRH
jgi:outer membrane protein assembly factor BamB